jgi:outer membrane lipoprotein carrier protein
MINKGSKHIVCLVIFWLVANGSMAEPTPETKLKQLLAPIVSLSAKFSQRNLNIQDKVIDQASGNFLAMAPDRFNWVIEQPMAQQILSNGTKLWVYDPDLAQVIIQPFDNTAQPNPISLLLNNPETLDQYFEISYINNQRSLEGFFLLKPRQSNAIYTELELEFVDQKPIGLRYKNKYSQIIEIKFNDLVINPRLSPTDFIFDIPADIDVVNHVR